MANFLPTATTNALGGYLSSLPTRLGIQPTQAHYDFSQDVENQAAAGGITGAEADFLKGQNLIEEGFNPVLAIMGAYPFQIADEVIGNLSTGESISPWEAAQQIGSGFLKGSKAAWNNLRGVNAGVYEEVEYPAFFLPDKVESADPNYKWSLDDPNLRRALLLQKTSLTRIPGSGRQGEEYINEAIARDLGKELAPSRAFQFGGPPTQEGPLTTDEYDVLTHIAMGSGNPAYRASLPIYGMIGDVDKYGERVQDFVTDAVTKEYVDRGITDIGTIFADPRLIKSAGEKSQLNIDWLQTKKQALADQPSLGEDDLRAISDQAAAQAFKEIKKGWGIVQPVIQEPPAEAEESWIDKALRTGRVAADRWNAGVQHAVDWGGLQDRLIPEVDAFGIQDILGRGLAPSISGTLTDPLLGDIFDKVDEIRQVESPEGFFPFVGDTGVGEYIEPEVMTPEVRVQEYVSEGVDRGLAEALVDQREEETRQQVIQDALKAEQDRIREENRIAADEAAARQEQVRADNQRRADEAARAAEEAQRNRKAQEAQAKEAARIARESQAADDRKSAARAQERANAAKERERQAAIERKEADARQRATEKAAADQRAADDRKQAARAQAAAEKKRADDLLAKQMADMFKSMEETRKRQEALNAQRLLSSFTAPARTWTQPSIGRGR